jgi:hypothetical protein
MKRLIAVALVGSALAFAGAATAAAPAQHAADISLFAFVGGSTAVEGHVRDAPIYGGITTSNLWCCEVSVVLERNFNAGQLRGSVSGRVSIGGNANDTLWQGDLHGSMTPEGTAGQVVIVERVFSGGTLVPTGRKFVGSWGYAGHPDQSRPHNITIHFEGSVFG